MNINSNPVAHVPSRAKWPPPWLEEPSPQPKPAPRSVNPTLIQFRAEIEKAKAKAPAGIYGQALVRVLADLVSIAEQYERVGLLDVHVAGLRRCRADYVRNSLALAEAAKVTV